MRKILVILCMTAFALTVLGGTAALGAPPQPVEKVTGSVEMSGPVQYVSFEAFESTPVKGSVRYTNFELPAPGTGVWVPDAFAMGFAVDPSTTIVATYSMTVTSFTPISSTSVAFTGTGDCGCGWVSTFTGTLSDGTFTLSMTEINAGNPAETYALSASGPVQPTGTVTGVWSDNYGAGRTGTFTIADIGYEVFHYVAPVQTAVIEGSEAWFSYTIPAGVPYAGVVVYVHVADGGSPGFGNDSWGHGTSGPGGPFTYYQIVAGNLTVHS